VPKVSTVLLIAELIVLCGLVSVLLDRLLERKG
jgi:hypothetical protein